MSGPATDRRSPDSPGRRATDAQLCMLTVRISTELYDALYLAARREGLNISDVVRLWIRKNVGKR